MPESEKKDKLHDYPEIFVRASKLYKSDLTQLKQTQIILINVAYP